MQGRDFGVSTHQNSYFASRSAVLSLAGKREDRGGEALNLFSACSALKLAMHNSFSPAAATARL